MHKTVSFLYSVIAHDQQEALLCIVKLILFVRFVDAEGYMANVADAILKAEEEIFITDWWFV